MKVASDRLTLRGVNSLLKRGLALRSQREKISMEKAILAILTRDLRLEIEQIKKMDEEWPGDNETN